MSPQDPPAGRSLPRRRFLVGAGAVVVASGAGVASRTFGSDGVDGVVPDTSPGRRLSGSFVSDARRGRTVGWTVAWPTGSHEALPVAVVLHGRGNDHASAFSRCWLARG